MEDTRPYNPLTKRNLAESIVTELLKQEVKELPPERFVGAGIYAIYFTGAFPPYEPIANANRDSRYSQPIYVGKAVPAGSRKGGSGLESPLGTALHKRMSEHAESISAAKNLKLVDFQCRWLVVDEVFIPLGETLLISHYKPLWNLVVDGFGNHPPGGGRTQGKKSMWDVLHPGRSWADHLSASVTQEQILDLIRHHWSKSPRSLSALDA